MGVNKRIKDLEDKVLMQPKFGTTQFCHWALPENEQYLLEQARKIVDMEIPYAETTVAQRTILDEACKLLQFRIFDLFLSYLQNLLCQDDKIAIITLHERFLWFIRELPKEIKQQLEVSEIERNTPEDCEVDKVDEYFRKAPEVFTDESYEKIGTDALLEMIKANPNFLTDLSKKGETVSNTHEAKKHG